MESLTWATMMLSMLAAGLASQTVSPRVIGLWSGVLSSLTALYWGLLDWRGRLPEPPALGIAPDELEIHGEPTV